MNNIINKKSYSVNIIVAYCNNNGIGNNNTMPWKIKSDLSKFKKLTTGNGNNAIVMGKNTWESIIKYNKGKALNMRDNLILSTSLNIAKENNNNLEKSFNSLDSLYNFISLKNYDEIWILGGEKIYNLFLNKNNNSFFIVKNIYVTYVDYNFECDTFFPYINDNIYNITSKLPHISEYNTNNTNNTNSYKIYDIIYSLKDNINNHNKDCQ